jgi:hypothetical protein
MARHCPDPCSHSHETEFLEAGRLPSVFFPNLSLKVTRQQFMVRLLESNGLKDFHFTIEEKESGSWPDIQVKLKRSYSGKR